MKTLDEARLELWEAGLNYGKACIELGLSKETAIRKYLTSANTNIDKDKDTETIAKCAITFAYC